MINRTKNLDILLTPLDALKKSGTECVIMVCVVGLPNRVCIFAQTQSSDSNSVMGVCPFRGAMQGRF